MEIINQSQPISSSVTNSNLQQIAPVPPQTQPSHNKTSRLPSVLIIAGVVEAALVSLISLSILPKLASIYSEFKLVNTTILLYIVLSISFINPLFQIIYGFILRNKQRVSGITQTKDKALGIIILVIGLVLFIILTPLLIISAILPVFTLTSPL